MHLIEGKIERSSPHRGFFTDEKHPRTPKSSGLE